MPDGLPPLLSANPVVGLMAPEPPTASTDRPGHPLAGLVHLGEGCDVRPVLSTMAAPRRRAPAGDPDAGRAPAVWPQTCCLR